ncbi:vanadium-dependent haloperoxidase [Colwellia sp. BRX8-7]|uniref:vanadium-dependent haloperoxidase n=1 Tax=Colwellia sp. BRX8-7 TaxID=2759833 RepID=UPI002174F0DD|nr:vanadium-dependent haloperoxidase [Colwellia sp. BRX8-7]
MKIVKNIILSLMLSPLLLTACGGSSSSSKNEVIVAAPITITPERSGQSVARQWNEVLLHAIRNDYARPTVHARNLFHISSAMFDAWSVYRPQVKAFLWGNNVAGFNCLAQAVDLPIDIIPFQEQAISFASYKMIKHRFRLSPGANNIIATADALMTRLGFDVDDTSIDYANGSAAALGNAIAQCYINFGLQDGANEQQFYSNRHYQSVNPALALGTGQSGNPTIVDLNRWQPLSIQGYIDQAGNPVDDMPEFLSPEWGQVVPFSLSANDKTVFTRDGFDYQVYHDPGMPPLIGSDTADLYKWGFSLVAIWSAHLDENDGVEWDISPKSIGNINSFPTTFSQYNEFYNQLDGGDTSAGYILNPVTNQPYQEQIVPRGDYGRVLAEFWADGPESETPPGHWFVILNTVSDHNLLEKRWAGTGEILGNLEWDIKSYFAMGGTMHDAAIAAWGIKGRYDYIRPVSAIRAMADLGQSSDEQLPSYHLNGILLVDGYIELVGANDALAGDNKQNVGKVKIYGWKGPDYINNPATDKAGVDWILAENWWPYQRPSFVTPPFAGYVSGHSTYSRAAAELMTAMTGSRYFPGGMSQFDVVANEFLVFEQGPSVNMTLQWATYQDASDQCSLSRIWGGIHPPADDITGRLIGEKIGKNSFEFVQDYFSQ